MGVRVDIMTVKELLGHESLNMTLRYAHLAPGHKVKAMEMFDSHLNNQAQYTIGGLTHKKSTTHKITLDKQDKTR